jgi:hypothetical protein
LVPWSRPIIYKHFEGARHRRVHCRKRPIVNRTETAKHSEYPADSQLFQGATFLSYKADDIELVVRAAGAAKSCPVRSAQA